MRVAGDLESLTLVFLMLCAVIGFMNSIRHKWQLMVARRKEIKRLMDQLAAEETARVERGYTNSNDKEEYYYQSLKAKERKTEAHLNMPQHRDRNSCCPSEEMEYEMSLHYSVGGPPSTSVVTTYSVENMHPTYSGFGLGPITIPLTTYSVGNRLVTGLEGSSSINRSAASVGGSSSKTKPKEELKEPDNVGHPNPRGWYQIFLCFRGDDTRYNFTGYLYDALKQEKFKVFMDDRALERGDSISQVITKAIENSKLSIIVFSDDFANSTWCLDEVVKINECRQKKNQIVWSVFYKVDPSDVRHQRNTYEKAMVKQETRYGKYYEKVKKWKSALSQVCDLNAFHYKKNSRYEGDFIQDIVKDVIKIKHRL